VLARERACYRVRRVSADSGLHMASHAELVRCVVGAGGNREAETELCRRFAPRVRLYGLKHLRDDERARELVQAVLVAMIEAMRSGRVEDPDRFDRFVLGICRNLTGRLRYVEGRAQPTDIERLTELDVRSVLPPERELDVEALLRCMRGLEVRARTVLHLTFYRDQSADQIASLLATSAGNVRVLRHRAVAQLRDCLEGAS
jgi:RNA polymerase sigma-70 factor, ECF subfamily